MKVVGLRYTKTRDFIPELIILNGDFSDGFMFCFFLNDQRVLVSNKIHVNSISDILMYEIKSFNPVKVTF